MSLGLLSQDALPSISRLVPFFQEQSATFVASEID